jgi:hypothetical protein
MPLLHDWNVVCTSDRYTAPEFRAYRLVGYIYGSEKFPDGYDIKTSQLRGVTSANCASFQQGDQVTTRSGSIYELGEPAGRSFLTYEEHVSGGQRPAVDPKREDRMVVVAH